MSTFDDFMIEQAVSKNQELDKLREINRELLESLRALVEQFHAYENGWLGEGVWRERIGLPLDLQRAEAVILKAEERL